MRVKTCFPKARIDTGMTPVRVQQQHVCVLQSTYCNVMINILQYIPRYARRRRVPPCTRAEGATQRSQRFCRSSLSPSYELSPRSRSRSSSLNSISKHEHRSAKVTFRSPHFPNSHRLIRQKSSFNFQHGQVAYLRIRLFPVCPLADSIKCLEYCTRAYSG
jgi:hypothetical protein